MTKTGMMIVCKGNHHRRKEQPEDQVAARKSDHGAGVPGERTGDEPGDDDAIEEEPGDGDLVKDRGELEKSGCRGSHCGGLVNASAGVRSEVVRVHNRGPSASMAAMIQYNDAQHASDLARRGRAMDDYETHR
jgi:hypothetical protein